MKLHWLFHRYQAPAGDDGAGNGGGAADRGDDWTPTDTDAADAARAAAVANLAAAAAAETPEAKAAAAAAAAEAESAAADAKAAADAAAAAAAEEGEGDETDPAKKKANARIPLARHEAVLKKERDARADVERQLAAFQKGTQVADINATLAAMETKIVGLEAEYSKLIADGEVEKATAKMTEIRRLERGMAESKSDFAIAAAEARATERARYNISLERVEQAYPTLNPDHESFDAELLTNVADLKVTYERKGLTPTEALQKAVKLLVKPATGKQEAATEVKPNVDAAAIAAERKKDAVAKTADAVAKTPASLKDAGKDSDKAGGGAVTAKDVMKMSYKDFANLDEATLARARGDQF